MSTSTLRRCAAVLAVVTGLLAAVAGRAEACTGCAYNFFQAETGAGVQVSGTYTPLVGNFAGDGHDDIFWYAPGSAPDSLWVGGPRGSFSRQAFSVNGTYTPVVGNFSGDGYTDILWYAPGSAADSLWTSVSTPATFSASAISIGGTYQPIVLRHSFAAAAAPPSARSLRILTVPDQLVWYAPGSGGDSIWLFDTSSPGRHTSQSLSLPGSPRLVPLYANGDVYEDLFFYNPGTGTDATLLFDAGGGFSVTPYTVNGSYQLLPVGATLNQQILWLGAGSAVDALWGNFSGTLTSVSTDPVNASGPIGATSGASDAYIYNATGPDLNLTNGQVTDALDTDIPAGAVLVRGDFDGDGGEDLLAYRPGSGAERLYSGMPSAA